MGLFHHSCDRYADHCNTELTLPNPNPNNYKIIMSASNKKFLVVLINYPDCTNYEGNKILLYKGITLSALKAQRKIDPHFSDNANYASPIARFEPTKYGWDCAIKLMESLG